MNPVIGEGPPARSAPAGPQLALQLRQRPLRRDLRAIFGEGAAASLMVGLGESYLSAFVLALGLGQVAAGLITTIPLMVGGCLQLVTPTAIRRLGSHRRWAIACAVLQALSLWPMAAGAAAGSMTVLAVFAAATLYWGSGLAVSSTWSAWVGTLVPRRIRTEYFSGRTRAGQLATLVGFLGAGASLQWAAANHDLLTAFAVVFAAASVCRLMSAGCMSRQSEGPSPVTHSEPVSLGEFCRRFREPSRGRILFYLLSVQAAAQIAGPYFTPFMLGPMRLSYATYAILIGVAFMAKALAMPAMGRVAMRFGTHRLLWLGGLGIVPIAGLWVLSRSFWFLFGVQVLSGITWAAYELAMLLVFFEIIPPRERTSVLTSFNLANSIATAAGSLLGGGLLALLAKQPEAYLLLFALSSSARVLTLLALWRIRAPAGEREETSHAPDSDLGAVVVLPSSGPERPDLEQPSWRHAA